MNTIIEIACTDFNTAVSAAKGGADRLELCSALSEGGITPSFALIKMCRDKIAIPLFPIIRPRRGDFLYSDDECNIMREDVRLCKQTGCDGIVVGFLQKDGSIDKEKTKKIVEIAYPLEVTFHRAFDRCRDPFEALEDIVEAGCQRILTSGQQTTAMEGVVLISELIKKADNRIVIMPGSGINPSNIFQMAQQTGAVEFHASLKSVKKSDMEFMHSSFAGSDDYENAMVYEDEVRKLKQALLQ